MRAWDVIVISETLRLRRRPLTYSEIVRELHGDRFRAIDAIDELLASGSVERVTIDRGTQYRAKP